MNRTEPSTYSRVAIFDVDYTLIHSDCFLIALRKLARTQNIFFPLLTCLPNVAGWILGTISTLNLKEKILKAFNFCEITNNMIIESDDPWLLKEIVNSLRPEAVKRLKWHKSQGHRVILCSASPRIFLQDLAAYLEVELICTEMDFSGGLWYPILNTPNCKGKEKLVRLKNLLNKRELSELEVYGDSRGDKEILEFAKKPHYRSFANETIPYKKSIFSL